MSKNVALILGLFLCIIPLVYLIYIYKNIPPEIPLHYNWKGDVDRIGPKTELITMVGLLSGLNLLMLLLFTNLKKINPQKSKVVAAESFNKFGILVCTFLCLLQVYILYKAIHPGTGSVKILLTLCSLFFMILGNFMHSLKHNYFAGIRTPWTLADEENWNATHRIGGKIWFWGGLICSICCLVTPIQFATVVFTAIVLVMAFIPILYSFIYFKRKNENI